VQDIANLAVGAQLSQEAILNNAFSEHAEEDADHTGMIFAMKAGFNPVGMYAMLMRLKEDEDRSPDVELGYLRDHPLTSQRVAAAKAELLSLGYPVTPHSLREAEGTMLAVVTTEGPPNAPTATDITLGDTQIARLAPSEHDEAVLAASQLNQLLDNNLQLYEVKSQGPILLARDYPVITFSDADVALAQSASSSPTQPAPTAESLASSAAGAIRNELWRDAVTGTSETDIDVGDTVSAMP
jgi:predicted Zn-dependent protease